MASTFSGGVAVVSAGRDVTLLGFNLIAEQDLRVATGRDIQVLAAEETYTSYQYEKVKKSGIGAGGA